MLNYLTRKQIIIVASVVIFVLALIGLVVYFAIKNQSKKGLNLVTNAPTSLVLNSVLSSTLSHDGNKIYYFDSKTKTFKQYDIVSGKISNLFNKTFDNVYKIQWSPNKSNALLSTSETSSDNQYKIGNYIIDLGKGESKTINLSSLDNLNWSSQDNQIVYSSANTNNTDIDYIYIANYDGTDVKKVGEIKDFGAPLVFNWPSPNTIEIFKSFYNPPETYLSEADQGSFLVSLSLSTGKLSNENIGNDISDISFSPQGNYVAFRKEIDTSFQIKDSQGLHDTKTPMDSSSSLAWNKDNQFLISFVVNNSGSAVDIYRIDLSDYSSKKITEFNTDQTTNIAFIVNAMIYNSGKYLFFCDQNTIYGLKTNL